GAEPLITEVAVRAFGILVRALSGVSTKRRQHCDCGRQSRYGSYPARSLYQGNPFAHEVEGVQVRESNHPSASFGGVANVIEHCYPKTHVNCIRQHRRIMTTQTETRNSARTPSSLTA